MFGTIGVSLAADNMTDNIWGELNTYAKKAKLQRTRKKRNNIIDASEKIH